MTHKKDPTTPLNKLVNNVVDTQKIFQFQYYMQQIIINKTTNSKSQVNRIFGGIQQIKSMGKKM